jgi:cytochrome c5
MLSELDDRVRDIKVAVDGSIYILSQKGTLHRLHRPPFVAVDDGNKGKWIYEVVCAACHATGSYGAPNLSVLSDWKGIENQSLELTYKHSIEGFNQMPPRGLCSTCTDRHVQQTVDYMLQQISSLKPD